MYLIFSSFVSASILIIMLLDSIDVARISSISYSADMWCVCVFAGYVGRSRDKRYVLGDPGLAYEMPYALYLQSV